MDVMNVICKQGDGFGKVGLETRPIPAIGENDVLVKIKAAGLCGSDVNTYRGRKTTVQPGTVLGHEFSGDVVQVGANVRRWKIGDRIVSDNTGSVCGTCYACSRGDYLMCEKRKGIGSAYDGGFASYVRIPGEALLPFPNALMKIPDNVSYEEAAILDPYANAYNALIQQGGMTPGDIVLVAGAGPLALACIDVARVAGASKIINLVRSSTSELHRSASSELGADILLESDKIDFAQYVLDLTGGEGIPIVADAAGPNAFFAPFVRLLRKGGKLLKIGYDWDPLEESMVPMTHRNISVIGHMGYNPTAWKQVFALLEAGLLHPSVSISRVMPLTEFHQAMQLALERKVIKVVFHPES